MTHQAKTGSSCRSAISSDRMDVSALSAQSTRKISAGRIPANNSAVWSPANLRDGRLPVTVGEGWLWPCPQKVVPILASLRLMNSKLQIPTPREFTTARRTISTRSRSCLIRIHCCHDFSIGRHARSRTADKLRLKRVQLSTDRGIARAMIGIQHRVRQGINGALAEHEPLIVGLCMA